MKSLLMKVLTGLFLGQVLASEGALAQDAPEWNELKIKRITYAGRGCRGPTSTDIISLDRKAFTVIFSDFLAEVGPGANGGRKKIKCKVTIDLQVPNGWSYHIFNSTYRGYLFLEEDVTAYFTSSYNFQGMGNANEPSKRDRIILTSDNNDFFQADFQNEYSPVVWAPCGKQRAVTINTELELEKKKGSPNSGFFAIDSLDGEFHQKFHIAWKRC